MVVGENGRSGLLVHKAVTMGLEAEAGHVTSHFLVLMGLIVLVKMQNKSFAMKRSALVSEYYLKKMSVAYIW